MTKDDDLVKRLRAVDHLSVEDCFTQSPLYGEAADLIEALDKACKEWADVSQRSYQRAKAAEAKLAKAREALGEAWFMLTVPHLDYEPEPEEPGLRRIKTTLAELKGDKP